MKMKSIAMTALAMMVAGAATAQDEQPKGYVTGSFESSSICYTKDTGIENASYPDDKIGSNNYLKVDYYRGKFAAGVQLEGYFPAQQNFPAELDGAKLTNYYVRWADKDFTVTAGTFYDQFGSGLLFRSWEDRALGLNNAVMGARFTYSFRDIVNVKLIWGLPRFGMEFSETQVRGGDLQLNLGEAFGWKKTSFSIEGSVLNRYEEITLPMEDAGCEPSRTGYSARINFERKGLSVHAEYVDAGDKYYTNPDYMNGTSPNAWTAERGNAQLLEIGYNKRGLGINFTGRRLEWMDSQITMVGNGVSSTANLLNYVPAICTQYTYLLTTLHPYNPQTGKTSGVVTSGAHGGPLTINNNFRRNTTLGNSNSMKEHANFSTYYSIQKPGSFRARNMLYRDLSVDIEKQFSKKFKGTILWSMQEKSATYGDNQTTHLQNIFVADMLYKFTPKFSGRLELQYLTTHEDEKDWMAALVELNFAPAWSIWGSDMYNHGMTDKHYYNIGVSYAKSRTRVALGYGRFKDGYLCSGGVCRAINAYTGANLQITTSF